VILADEIVVITGVGPGLGAKLAVRAAAEGAKVVMAARSAEVMEQVAKEVGSSGG
jgi:NADP-dependent 3-hydroxy acid dehydrogenase YdfG